MSAVSWSREMACYKWDCIFGCADFDFESAAEASLAFERHDCVSSR